MDAYGLNADPIFVFLVLGSRTAVGGGHAVLGSLAAPWADAEDRVTGLLPRERYALGPLPRPLPRDWAGRQG